MAAQQQRYQQIKATSDTDHHLTTYAQAHATLSPAEIEYRREHAKSEALGKIFWHSLPIGLGASLGGGGISYALSKHRTLGKYMSWSVRMAIPAMIGMAVFSVAFEQGITDSILYPERWGLKYQFKPAGFVNEDGSAIVEKKYKPLPFYQKAVNFVYDYNVQLTFGIGMPWLYYVARTTWAQKEKRLIQKIGETRVVAQAGVAAVLFLSVAFKEIVKANGGKFKPELEDQDAH